MRKFWFHLATVPAAVIFVPLGYVWQACVDCFATGRGLYGKATEQALLVDLVAKQRADKVHRSES